MTTVICSEPVTIDWSCLARPCRCKPTAWSTPSSGAGGGRCGGRGARVLAYQPYTFTSGDEVKFQRGPGLFLGLGERQRDDDGAGGLGGGPVMSESTMRYDPENDIFFHKHEDGS